ncbi:hypothetical protein Dfer_5223 [Dyadobacter fermentans DSM 18053]|uniref:Uncharacterized protein n=1 Tax=Dyadobacter fermentans (strain ATCC 700827 / DSM 18053 / CIP 107007 / KCTC 52180 / NS114) TaxID=471854 RepID=C6VT57_DYAFD|nr:hypothetical protein Dfer_5223 [Dyadobacter fermentans DSM 18053]
MRYPSLSTVIIQPYDSINIGRPLELCPTGYNDPFAIFKNIAFFASSWSGSNILNVQNADCCFVTQKLTSDTNRIPFQNKQ